MFKIAQGAGFLVVRIAHLREGLVLDILETASHADQGLLGRP